MPIASAQVVALPTLYILVAVFVSIQFSVVLGLLATAAVKVRSIPQLGAIEPGTRVAVFAALQKSSCEPNARTSW